MKAFHLVEVAIPACAHDGLRAPLALNTTSSRCERKLKDFRCVADRRFPFEQSRKVPELWGRLSVINTDHKTRLCVDANNDTSLIDLVEDRKVHSSQAKLTAVALLQDAI
jgi:hypothetical protein